jgi:hypothetical protein
MGAPKHQIDHLIKDFGALRMARPKLAPSHSLITGIHHEC